MVSCLIVTNVTLLSATLKYDFKTSIHAIYVSEQAKKQFFCQSTLLWPVHIILFITIRVPEREKTAASIAAFTNQLTAKTRFLLIVMIWLGISLERRLYRSVASNHVCKVYILKHTRPLVTAGVCDKTTWVVYKFSEQSVAVHAHGVTPISKYSTFFGEVMKQDPPQFSV